MTVSRRALPLALFAAVAGGVYAVAFHISAILPSLDRPGAIAAGVTLDLAVVVPIAWYFLVARRLGWSWLTLVPPVAAGMFTASRILPAAHHGTLGVLELAIVPLELALLGYVGWRVVTGVRRARTADIGDDPIASIRTAARTIMPHPRLAEVFAYEASVLFGGLMSWWLRPPEPGPSSFAFHRRDAYASVVLGLLVVLAIELFPVHLLIARWSPLAAWIVTGLSVYGAVWMIADLQAMRLRPIRLTPGGLDLRVGLRWEVPIPIDAIARIERITSDAPRAPKGGLKLVPFGSPTHRVTTHVPVTARGPYGLGRTVRTVDFGVDEPARFDERLALLGVPGTLGAAGGTTGAGAGRTPAEEGTRGGRAPRNGR